MKKDNEGKVRVEREVRLLGGRDETFMGFPLSWFVPSNYLDAHGVINRDGSLGLPDHGGSVMAFRMRRDKMQLAGWQA